MIEHLYKGTNKMTTTFVTDHEIRWLLAGLRSDSTDKEVAIVKLWLVDLLRRQAELSDPAYLTREEEKLRALIEKANAPPTKKARNERNGERVPSPSCPSVFTTTPPYPLLFFPSSRFCHRGVGHLATSVHEVRSNSQGFRRFT